eukprot:gene9436-10421_t
MFNRYLTIFSRTTRCDTRLLSCRILLLFSCSTTSRGCLARLGLDRIAARCGVQEVEGKWPDTQHDENEPSHLTRYFWILDAIMDSQEPFYSDSDVDSDIENMLYGQLHYLTDIVTDEHSEVVIDESLSDQTIQDEEKKTTEAEASKGKQDSEKQDQWSIVDKDRGINAVATDAPKSRNRYYIEKPKSKIWCFNCRSRGHMMYKVCLLCGETNHSRWDCPNDICYNCFELGHISKFCKQPKKNSYAVCKRCWGRGHNRNTCPEIWRQYHLTVEDNGKIKKANRSSSGMAANINKLRFCHNCCSDDHFTHDCEQHSHNRRQVNSPFIVYYDKCPYKPKEKKQAKSKQTARKSTKPKQHSTTQLPDGSVKATAGHAQEITGQSARNRKQKNDEKLSKVQAVVKQTTDNSHGKKTGRRVVEPVRKMVSEKGKSLDVDPFENFDKVQCKMVDAARKKDDIAAKSLKNDKISQGKAVREVDLLVISSDTCDSDGYKGHGKVNSNGNESKRDDNVGEQGGYLRSAEKKKIDAVVNVIDDGGQGDMRSNQNKGYGGSRSSGVIVISSDGSNNEDAMMMLQKRGKKMDTGGLSEKQGKQSAVESGNSRKRKRRANEKQLDDGAQQAKKRITMSGRNENGDGRVKQQGKDVQSQSKSAGMENIHPERQNRVDTHPERQNAVKTHSERQNRVDTHSERQNTVRTHSERQNVVNIHPERQNRVDTHPERQNVVKTHSERQNTVKTHSERQNVVNIHPERQNVVNIHPERQNRVDTHPERQNVVKTHSERQNTVNTHPERQNAVKTHSERQNVINIHPERQYVVNIHQGRQNVVKKHSDRQNIVKTHSERSNVVNIHPERQNLVDRHPERQNIVNSIDVSSPVTLA